MDKMRLVDANGRYTLHASDNTDYSLLFKNGIICVENELGHCVCEFFADDVPTVDAVAVPCKMGDEVWGLKKYRSRLIPEKGVVYQMYFGDDMRLCICVKNVCRGEWGKNVFATKEEADAALAKMDGGNEVGQM